MSAPSSDVFPVTGDLLGGMEASHVRWGRVGSFLVLVFLLSWGSMLAFAFDAAAGERSNLVPPLGMFVPALVAICLRVGLFRDNPIHHGNYGEPPVWIFRGFVLLFVLQAAIAILVVTSNLPGRILGGIGTWSMIAWTALVIRLYKRYGEPGFARAGLQLGARNVGLKIAMCFVAFLVLQGVLDLATGRGEVLLGKVPASWPAVAEGLGPLWLVALFVLSIVGTPLGSLALLFGEEYGWRGFLQDELEPIGRRRAALVIGLIWGVWHVPILLGGIHTYPPTAQGFALAFLFFTMWGFVLSYAVHKTGSVWTAAVLHGIVNGLYWFLRTHVFRPEDKLLSFGLGLYGVICLALVVLVLSRDPVWYGGADEDFGSAPRSKEES